MNESVVVTNLVNLMIKQLTSAIWIELAHLWGVKDDIKKLQRLLSTISAVLDEAGKRSLTDAALRKWLNDLKEVALDADDVVDEFQTRALQTKMESNRDKPLAAAAKKVRCLFSCGTSSASFHFKMARKIKDVTNKLSEIVEERKNFHLVEKETSPSDIDRETYSYVVESTTFGRNADKGRVIEILTQLNDDDVSILPIVGLGGVGKTTLAQLVYNDVRIKEHFELQIWVCVGEDFDLKRISKTIVESAMKGECSYSDIESIQILVRQQLEDKRFLLVLDDVWTEDPMEWQRLKPLLTENKCGSKIVVTTRSEIVARIMSTMDMSPYRLESLTVEDCWILFRQLAFGARKREEETPRLVEIGKEIVSKCGGLPLAAKALGSLMASRKGEAEWMDVKNSDMWRLPEGSDAILLPARRLSYQHLTLDLKQCVAYCRLFPKGYRIDRLKLIQLWIAEGLVQTSDTDMHLEDIGNRYFNSLLWRSFFQDEENDDSGNVVSCMMHDLIHDLACYVASNDYFIIEDAKVRRSSVPIGCRHYSVICDKDLISSETFKFGCEAKKVRSLILLGQAVGVISPDVEKSLLNMISNLTRLRVLLLSGIRICTFPSAMAKLKYLRYLDLSFTEITTIPDSITSLYNLQTLNLRHCVYLKALPEALSNMSNLRHLDISDCGLTHMPHEMGRLVGIQTLPLFIVGEKAGRTVAELQNLNVIRGALAIKCLCNVKDPMGAVKAKLRAKVHLLSLELCWGMNEFWSGNLLPSNSTVEEDVIVNLQPPPNLKSLRIDKYTGNRCPDWLEKIDATSLSFSCLRTLELLSLPNLEEWNVPQATNMFPCLQRLVITRCPKLVVKPSMPCSIVELEIRGGNEELFAAGGSLQGLSELRKLEMTHIQLSAASRQWEGLQYLTNLEELTIGWCSELIHFPCCIMQRRFPTLRTLKLEGNLELASLGEGGEDPPLFFSALHHLSITDCGLLALPEWLGGVSSLQSLTLRFCRSLAMLPDGLQRLTGLYHLTVDNCRLLRRRCERDTGEDWHKIAHIPNIKVLNVLYL